MTGKYNLKDIGVVYLDELTSQDLPAGEASTGILSWDGSALTVRYSSNNLDVDVVFPTTDSLASTKTGVLAQNLPVYGSADFNTNNVLVGAVYLPAGTISAASAAYMKSLATVQNPAVLSITDTQQQGVVTFSQAGSVAAVPVSVTGAPAVITAGWYEIYLNVTGQNDSADVYGLRLVIT
jgi:hypothetical protein